MSPEKGIMSRQHQNQCTVLSFDSFSSVMSGRNDSHFVIKRSFPLRIHCDAHTHIVSRHFVTSRKIVFQMATLKNGKFSKFSSICVL